MPSVGGLPLGAPAIFLRLFLLPLLVLSHPLLCPKLYPHYDTLLVRGIDTSLDSARASLKVSHSLSRIHTRGRFLLSRFSFFYPPLSLSVSLHDSLLPSIYFSRSSPLGKSRARSRDPPSRSLSNADRKVGRRGLGARLVRSPCLPRNWGKMKLTEQSPPRPAVRQVEPR